MGLPGGEGREQERVESAKDHQALRGRLAQRLVQCIAARSRPIGTLRERVGRLTGLLYAAKAG